MEVKLFKDVISTLCRLDNHLLLPFQSASNRMYQANLTADLTPCKGRDKLGPGESGGGWRGREWGVGRGGWELRVVEKEGVRMEETGFSRKGVDQ